MLWIGSRVTMGLARWLFQHNLHVRPPCGGFPTRRVRDSGAPGMSAGRTALRLRSIAILAALIVWFGSSLTSPFGASASAPTPPTQSLTRSTQAQTFSRDGWDDWETLNGSFYTQATDTEDRTLGFRITNDGGIAFWRDFKALGGPDRLGYPMSRRFEFSGVVAQVTQRAVLEWDPIEARAVLVAVYDLLSMADLDGWLETKRLVPPAVRPRPGEPAFTEAIARERLRWLDASPALKAAFLSVDDPLEMNGFPSAPITDMGRVVVLRTQRRVFQYWKVATTFARAGQVTIMSVGEVVREAELFPAGAFEPEDGHDAIAAPVRSLSDLPDEQVSAWQSIREKVWPAVVELTDRRTGRGTGVVVDIDAEGAVVLTNNHVVGSVDRETLVARLFDGRIVDVEVIGADDWTDVAVVRLRGVTDLPALRRGTDVKVGSQVMAIGFGVLFPPMPSAKVGVIQGLAGEIQTFHDYPLRGLIQHDALISPGDSGGPLIDQAGRLIGMNSAIKIARMPRRGQELIGFSIPIGQAWSLASQLRASGKVPRPYLGVSVEDLTIATARRLGLTVTQGLLVREVPEASPAQKAGIVPGMVIVTFSGQTVTGLNDLRRLMVTRKVGDTVAVTVVGPGAARTQLRVVMIERPAPS
ncbi:MAG: PDZ domain-containing protein [Chloroflexi bacterium]|nr:PDZ domain-containing protein [Chloroflexota bacterium]